MLSQFVSDSFDPRASLCLIAGKGEYPKCTLKSLKNHNINVKLIGFEGETDLDLIDQFSPEDRVIIKVGQLGKMLKYLKKFGVSYAIMAGQITPRRLFRGLYPDLKAAFLLAKLKIRNAETIFGTIANEIEQINVKLLDARAFLDEYVTPKGPVVGSLKTKQEFLDHGIHIAKEISRLDIGQSVVVRKGTVLAVEGFEGTDNLIKRAGGFEVKDAVFIKASKPNQDFRFDVPVLGPNTLRNLAQAHIYQALIEAESSLILDKDNTLALAKKLGISIYGF